MRRRVAVDADAGSRPGPARFPAPLALPPLAALGAILLVALVLAATAPPATAVYRSGDDWRHVEAVIAALGKKPPTDPVVVLLGGSAARECVTTEPRWRSQIAAFGGGRVRAFNLGSSSQSFANDLTIVRALPGVSTVVLIGLNVGRYTSIPPKDAAATRVATSRTGSVYDSHRFHNGQRLSDGAKRALVGQWMRVKYPRFKRRYAGNAAKLRELISVCQEKGYYPVLVELPLDLRIVGGSWNRPRGTYRAGCRAAAAAYGIPYEDFVGRIGLRSHDFVDLSHLLETGRDKYQRRLSRLVVTRLRQYGLTGRTGSQTTVID